MSRKTVTIEVVRPAKEEVLRITCDYCTKETFLEDYDFTRIKQDYGWAVVSVIGHSQYDMCPICVKEKGLINDSA